MARSAISLIAPYSWREFFHHARRDEKMPISHRYKWLIPCVIVAAVALVGALMHDAVLAANGSVAYTYDALGRVTTASYDTGVCIIYSYDPNGNRLSETIKVSTAAAT